jgi:hypothetical protein
MKGKLTALIVGLALGSTGVALGSSSIAPWQKRSLAKKRFVVCLSRLLSGGLVSHSIYALRVVRE